jgi:hypothetical protein
VESRDLIVTPILLILVYVVAYLVRPWATDGINRKYFIPGLTFRIVGAIALGIVYQFYYHGGDTYNFHTHGSRHIWEAFWDSPDKGIKIFFFDGADEIGIYDYSSRIYFLRDKSSFALIRIAAFFDLFTFSTYSATAICFAVISFIGSWLLFLTFYKERTEAHRGIAFATLFVPSVCFWGSGVLKDTITLAALSVATFFIGRIFIEKKVRAFGIFWLFFSLYMLYSIKLYILLCFLPAAFLWLLARHLITLGSRMLQIIVLPFLLIITFVLGYYTVIQIGKEDQRYNISSIGETARVTAYDIAFQTGREAGSTYTLGELDGSIGTLVQLAPQAINVSLFRPYLWEVKNPLMLMSALESVCILILTLYFIFTGFRYVPGGLTDPNVIFCLIFSLTFAFAVGVSTYNFGTLSRYKIPLVPFYLIALVFLYDYSNKARKLSAFELTEY